MLESISGATYVKLDIEPELRNLPKDFWTYTVRALLTADLRSTSLTGKAFKEIL